MQNQPQAVAVGEDWCRCHRHGLLKTGAHANDQSCMVVAADTAALRKSALRQQPLACLTCMSTAGAFVTLAYGVSVSIFV